MTEKLPCGRLSTCELCTAPARLGAVVLTSAWLEDGPRGARDHSVWQWLSLRWRRHCSEARPWRSLSGPVPKIRPKAATSATTAGRRRCRVRAPTPTRVAGTPCGRVGVITKATKAQVRPLFWPISAVHCRSARESHGRTPCSWRFTRWLARSMPQHVPGSASQPFWWRGRRVAGACAPWDARAERQ